MKINSYLKIKSFYIKRTKMISSTNQTTDTSFTYAQAPMWGDRRGETAPHAE